MTQISSSGKPERLHAIKAELFETNLKNIDILSNLLDTHFIWCSDFSNDESMTKSEKLSFYELTVLFNQAVHHSKLLQDAIEECRESSIYWEDFFQCISEHYQEYNNDYIQYMARLSGLQETMQMLKKNERVESLLIKIQHTLECSKQDLDSILVYPKERMLQIQEITEAAILVLTEKSDVNALSVREKVELESCRLVLKVLNQILSPQESIGNNKIPSDQNIKSKSRHLCKVLYSFKSTQDDELTLKVDDIVEIIAQNPDNWWQGRIKDKVGLFPSNYVKEIPNVSSEEESTTDDGHTSDDSSDSGNFMQVKKGTDDQRSSHSITSQENTSKYRHGDGVAPKSEAQVERSKLPQPSDSSTLIDLQAQLVSAGESKAKAEAELQALIQKAEIAKAEAEEKARVLREILSSSGSESSLPNGPGKGSKSTPRSVPKKNTTTDVDKVNKTISKNNEDSDVDQIVEELDKLDAVRKQDVVYKMVECGVCKKLIERFVSKDGLRYCGSCYEDRFAVKCVKCTKAITADGLTFKTLSYHPDCFKCNHCQSLIAKEAFTSHEDDPYCYPCYGELYSKRCASCTLPITSAKENRFIRTNELYWHSDCFVCAKCKKTLAGREYVSPGGADNVKDIFCPECV